MSFQEINKFKSHQNMGKNGPKTSPRTLNQTEKREFDTKRVESK